jgi:hypothetical protein
MVTRLVLCTGLVATEKLTLDVPACTVTLAGTVAKLVLLLESVTDAPPSGATPSSVTTPVDAAPPVTDVGFSESEPRRPPVAGVTVSVAVFVTSPAYAVIVTFVLAVTGEVKIVVLPVVAPAGTTADVGMLATVTSLLVKVTRRPLGGAGALSVTTALEDAPPVTLAGFSVKDSSVVPAVMVRPALIPTPATEA